MNEISDLLEKGVVKSHISKSFTLDDIKDAHQQIETGKTKGKIVIKL